MALSLASTRGSGGPVLGGYVVGCVSGILHVAACPALATAGTADEDDPRPAPVFDAVLFHCATLALSAGCSAGLGGHLSTSLCAGARLLSFVASCRVRVGVTRGSLGAAGVGFPVTACAWIRVDDSVSMTLAWASSSSEYRATYWQTRHPLVARTWAGSRGGLAVGPPWHGVGRRRWPSALGSHPSAPACALLRRGRRQ